jgi:hypothetical protein
MSRSQNPALAAWRSELRRGERTTTGHDALWRAACAEMNAIEAEADGLGDAARRFRRRAAEILREAAQPAPASR